MKQLDLARKLKLSQSHIAKMEAGGRLCIP
jgi:hypothetical protein